MRHRRRSRGAVRPLVIVSCCVLACSSKPRTLVESLPLAYGTVCQRLATCAPVILQQAAGGDVAACLAWELESLTPSWSADGVATTVADMDLCVAHIKSSCDAFLGVGLAFDTGPCKFAGSYADGAVCGTHFQCASGNCKREPGQACGRCTARAAADAACSSNFDCAPGLLCQSQKCVAYGARGASCEPRTAPCRPPLACVGGVCGSPLPLGAECTELTSQCDFYAGHLCHPLQAKCVTPRYGRAGEPCGLVGNDVVACSGGSCKPNALSGTCVAFARDGQPCGPDGGRASCLAHSECIDSRCRIWNPADCR